MCRLFGLSNRSVLLKTLLAVAITAVFTPPDANASYSWRNVVIGGGGFVTGIVFHPKERDLIYARTDGGGAYRWNEANSRWISLNDNLGANDTNLTSVLSVAVDVLDPNRVYLACGLYADSYGVNGSILRSNDRGASWSRTDLPVKLGGYQTGNGSAERLQVDPKNSSILFLGTSRDGLWKSTDSGVTWNRVTSFPGEKITSVLFDPSAANPGLTSSTLVVGVDVSFLPRFLRSTDAGETWTDLKAPGVPYQIAIDSKGNLYGTFEYGSFGLLGSDRLAQAFKLPQGSSSWIRIGPTGIRGALAGISVSSQQPGSIVLSNTEQSSTTGAVYRSQDGGNTWQAILTGNPVDYSSAPWAASIAPDLITDVEIDPFRSNRVFFATTDGVFVTNNATASDVGQAVNWKFQNEGLENSYVYELVSPPLGAPLVSALYHCIGFRHDNLDISPSSREPAPGVGTVLELNFAELKPTVMMRTDAVEAQFSTDGAITWKSFPTIPSRPREAGKAAVSADGKRFLLIKDAGAYVSTDEGASWSFTTSSVTNPLSSIGISLAADRVNPNKFYVYDPSNGLVSRSFDGGVSFSTSAQALPFTYGRLRAVPGKEGHLWLPTASGGLYRSADSGSTFEKAPDVERAYAVGFGRAAEGQSYPAIFISGVVAGIDGVFRSDDGGASWNRINDDQHRFGYAQTITGDPRIFGRVYLGTTGRGIVYGDTAAGEPIITAQPSSIEVVNGSTAIFSVIASSGTSYQWYKDGSAIPGATSSTLTLTNVEAADVGSYKVVITGMGGSITSNSASLTLVSEVSHKLINISTRSYIGSGGDVLIAGFIIGGSQSKQVIIRGSGPALAPFNVGAFMTDPILTLHDGTGNKIGENDDWSSTTGDVIEATAARVGAFAWPRNSKDAALVVTLPPGAYTAILSGKNGQQGIGLIELYEADITPTAVKLINISSRALVKAGGEILIGGFTIGGQTPKRVLIRASGPVLAPPPFNVPGVLSDPILKVFEGQNLIAQNDDWATDAMIDAAFTSTGAFAWPRGSKDAALVLTLPPGGYTVHVTGKGSDQGVALFEVFEYP